MKKLIFGLLLLASTNYALAYSSTPITKIDRIFTYGEFAVLSLENGSGTAEGCSSGDFVTFNITTEAGRILYSAALTAFTTNAKVRFGIHECFSWGGTIPKAYRLEMLK